MGFDPRRASIIEAVEIVAIILGVAVIGYVLFSILAIA
jgi:hypothetical protein